MGKLIADSWFGRAGRDGKKGGAEPEKAAKIGVLAFEMASLMSKALSLWHSLRDEQVARLRDEVLHLGGVRKLVSDDDDFLLGLALAEAMDSLGFLAHSAARLGKRCAHPGLHLFEHLFADLMENDTDPYSWEYTGRKMERKVKKMEMLVSASANLYQELEVLAELEQGLRRMQATADPTHQGSLIDAKQKVIRQRQEVKCLREASLWNRSYDYAIGLLARSLFTIVGRIRSVFGLHHNGADNRTAGNTLVMSALPRSHSVTSLMHYSGHPSNGDRIIRFSSGPLVKSGTRSGSIATTGRGVSGRSLPCSSVPPRPGKRLEGARVKWPVSGPFKGCMAGGNGSVLQSCITVESGSRRLSSVSRIHKRVKDATDTHFQANFFKTNISLSLFKSKHKLMNAPPSTLGSAGLALRYANIIIVIEKLAASPHLIGPDARDDLYGMLTTSIRAALRARLKMYAKNLASTVYDPVLAAEWSEALTRVLEWLSPLAHNMVRWQSERNFEQQHLASSTNILLLQTLYFANQTKTEAAITELLVGLNYLWRFGKELNAKAILECLSDRDFDDYLNSKD